MAVKKVSGISCAGLLLNEYQFLRVIRGDLAFLRLVSKLVAEHTSIAYSYVVAVMVMAIKPKSWLVMCNQMRNISLEIRRDRIYIVIFIVGL